MFKDYNKRITTYIAVLVMLFAFSLKANSQQSTDDTHALLEKNNKIVKTLLDYRYKGGSGAANSAPVAREIMKARVNK